MANKRLATLEQVKKLMQGTKVDSAARIAALAELIAQAGEEWVHAGLSIDLPASGWADRVQTVKDEFFLAKGTCWYFVCGDADNFAAWSEACVTADNITKNGEMTFHCLATPTVDLTVYILRLEVEL